MIKGIIGTVIGDIAGSSHEGKPVKSMRFGTLNKVSTVTDDTVLTMAVAEWMLDRENIDVADSLIKWAEMYPNAGYGRSGNLGGISPFSTVEMMLPLLSNSRP